jgi:hypothetical protein
VIGIIEHDHPRAALAGSLKPADFAGWSDEGFQAAEEDA